MTDGTYNNGRLDLLTNPWTTSDIRVILLETDEGLIFDRADVFVADVLGHEGNNEVSGPGYSREQVPNADITVDDNENRVIITHDNIAYVEIDVGAIGVAVYYRHVSDDDDSPVIFWKDSGFPFVTTGTENMVLRVGSTGLAVGYDLDQVPSSGD